MLPLLRVRSLWSLSLGFTLTMLSGCGGDDSTQPALPSGLLVNGDFEDAGVGDGPEAWFTQNGDEFSEFEWSRGMQRSGERSISIAVSEDALVGTRVYNWSQDIVDGFFDGERFELTGWVRTEALTQTAVVFVRCFAELAPLEQLCFETTETVVDLSGSRDWTEVRVPFEVAGGTRMLRVTVAITRVNRGGRAWFDDFSLVPK